MIKNPPLKLDVEYKHWLSSLKENIRNAQIKAALKVNSELLMLYWQMGAQIVERQVDAKWGDGLIKQLSYDLSKEFPLMKGFSETNLKLMKQWYLFYNRQIGQQLADQLPQNIDSNSNIEKLLRIPWGHNCLIIGKCKTVKEALFYVDQTIEQGWSRAALENQVESRLYRRKGKAITNFSRNLSAEQSDLANQLMKDPYNFDFLQLTEPYKERELETALIDNITKLLMELGDGFAYLGKQYPVHVGGKDFFLDLLFYHVKLHCYIVVELKTTEFQPEYAGKLNFYLTAIDKTLKRGNDNPTIGMLICKTKNEVIAEYSLQDLHKPIGVSEFDIEKCFSAEFKGSLPTIEEIEAGLKD